jgi:hypothetical protein
VAALIRAYYPNLTPDEVTRRITQTAEHPAQSWNPEVGYGVIDPARAVGSLDVPSGQASPTAGAGTARGLAPVAQPVQVGPGLTIAAAWITTAGVVIILAVLMGGSVTRRRRRRGWRADGLRRSP